MSDPNYQRDQLINTVYNSTRELRADVDDQKQRLDKLCADMNAFTARATELLTGMAADSARIADIEARLQRRGIAPTLDESEYITTNGN